MPAAGIGCDAGQHPTHIRIQAMASGELGGVLALERVRQVETLAFFMRVEHQQTDVGAAFEVGQAQQLTTLEHEGGVAATE